MTRSENHGERGAGKAAGKGAENTVEKTAKDQRAARLRLALRENLKRRKSQARERRDVTQTSSGSDDLDHDVGEENPG